MNEKIFFCASKYSNLGGEGLLLITAIGLSFGWQTAILAITSIILCAYFICDAKNADKKTMCDECHKFFFKENIKLVKARAYNITPKSEIFLCSRCQEKIGAQYIMNP